MGGSGTTRIVSYITRANYDYDKYYLGASWRTDGSSRLAKRESLGEISGHCPVHEVSSESFMRTSSELVEIDLKLRVSYGVNGTLPSSYYGYGIGEQSD